MGTMRAVAHSLLFTGTLAGMLGLFAGCTPKPPPPALPPTEVPHVNQLSDNSGERSNVVADAVQQGGNQARLTYDCDPPHSEGVEGKGVLTADVTKCEYNRAEQTLVLSNQSYADCPLFLVTINGYHGPGTYNTSALGRLGFGTAKLRHPACKWDGSICLEWNGASGPHPEATCTVEINNDGGLQYGTTGATVSGTFVCSDFSSSYKGCPDASAKANCAVTRASFSVAGCVVAASPGGDKDKGKGKSEKKEKSGKRSK